MKIINAHLLESIFGKWPSFHDAEIHTILLERLEGSKPRMDVKIHLWKMTNEVDAKGYFVLTSHTMATLRFHGVISLDLRGFNFQNVVSGLEIVESAEAESGLYVALPTLNGCDTYFRCAEIEVVAAEPYVANPRVSK